MILGIRSQLTSISREFTNYTKIGVSTVTQDLGADIISAIVQDPHPSWPQDLRYDAVANEILHNTPQMLAQISQSLEQRKTITAFDFLHWLSGNLDSVCPIPK